MRRLITNRCLLFHDRPAYERLQGKTFEQMFVKSIGQREESGALLRLYTDTASAAGALLHDFREFRECLSLMALLTTIGLIVLLANA